MARLDEALDGDFARLADESSASLDAFLSDLSIRSNVRARIEPSRLEHAAQELERARAALPRQTRLMHRTDPEYPQRFHILEYPPRFLYVRGQIGALHGASALAIVGSREARVEAIRQTRSMAEAVGRSGHVVVSGGARGVDSAAHRGAIDAGAQTVVVLPGAVDSPKPAKNSRLFRSALERGCLISEYPPGTGVRRYHFHRRNRLIAALGHWLLVVRAGKQSGTMITARAAAELGRPIMTVLGDVDDWRFAGCGELLAAGAAAVRDSSDVLRLLGASSEPLGQVDGGLIEDKPRPRRSAKRRDSPADVNIDPDIRAGLGEGASRVVSVFEERGATQELHLDVLRRDSGAGEVALETALLELELSSIIEKVPGKNAYRLVR
jgi:DNA processing protein